MVTREIWFITHQGSSVRSTADVLSGITEVKRQRGDIFKELKEKDYYPRILYPEKDPSKIKDKLRQDIPDEQKWRDLTTNWPALQEILKEVYSAKTDRIKKKKCLEVVTFRSSRLSCKMDIHEPVSGLSRIFFFN